jgi:hypothetical protein
MDRPKRQTLYNAKGDTGSQWCPMLFDDAELGVLLEKGVTANTLHQEGESFSLTAVGRLVGSRDPPPRTLLQHTWSTSRERLTIRIGDDWPAVARDIMGLIGEDRQGTFLVTPEMLRRSGCDLATIETLLGAFWSLTPANRRRLAGWMDAAACRGTSMDSKLESPSNTASGHTVSAKSKKSADVASGACRQGRCASPGVGRRVMPYRARRPCL